MRTFKILLILMYFGMVEMRGRGGGGGGRGGGGRGRGGGAKGSGLGSRLGRGSSYVPRSRTFYSSRGGISGPRGYSSNGFGMGLGRGLLIGYGTGRLLRPRTYLGRPSGYSGSEEPLECYFANTTLYFSSATFDQDLAVQEALKGCQEDQDICFGTMTIVSANFSRDVNTSTVFQVSVIKGCAKSTDFNNETSDSNTLIWTNQKNVCWSTQPMKEEIRNAPILNSLSESEFFSLSEDKLFTVNKTTFKLDESWTMVDVVNWQIETCKCDWTECNGDSGPGSKTILIALGCKCTELKNRIS